MVDILEEMVLKDRQIALLERFINEKLQETLLGDILSDSKEMLKKQINSDFSWADFRNYAEEIGQLKNDIIALQDKKNHLLIAVKDLQNSVDNLQRCERRSIEKISDLIDELKSILDN